MNKTLSFLWFKVLGIVLVGAISSCASYKGDIPLDSMVPEVTYISPMNQDGIQDEFVIPVNIPQLKGLKLAGYSIVVLSETDQEVYVINEGKAVPDGETKISGKKTPLPFPKEIIWRGTSTSGEWVSDGVYFMQISAWDYSGNSGELDPVRIIVDNTPPEAETTLPYLVFSPNGDGNQEQLDLYQKSSSEDEWLGEFYDMNNTVVKSFIWQGLAPDFQWDGTDNKGNMLDDNEFFFRLSSTDRAGNSYSMDIEGIVIETKSFAISISSDISVFSPNQDGILDTITYRLVADKPDQINQFRFVLTDETGAVRRTLTPGAKTFPQNVLFDGKDSNGKVLPEGHYYGVFSVVYINGNNPQVTSKPVELDVTAPNAVITRNYRIFSPDGDGKKDEITINQTTSVEELWEGAIVNASGTAVRTFQWPERGLAFNWDGKDDSGKLLPDGEYSYTVKSTDTAGLSGSFQSVKFVVDTTPTPVTVKNRAVAFSPNDDGINDFMEFELNPTVRDGILHWDYKITDTTGNEIFNFGLDDVNEIPETIAWNGADSSGQLLEGEFLGTLFVEYEKGNQASATIETPFVLDLTPPTIKHSLSAIPFSPDGDGVNDLLKINVDVSDDIGVKSWSASILDPTGQVFYSITSSQFRNGVFNWNGRSQKNELVRSASDYSLVVKAEDLVGNTITVSDVIPVDILVLKDGDKLKISISSINFKPFTADYLDLEPVLQAKNIATLDRLAVILQKYSSYKIQLEGHAVRILWNNQAKWLIEENETLLPLSGLRAESIRDALILRGIDEARMTTVGRGGYDPLVPHSDLINRWKNRRVEFILLK
jgi:outer membrane protein OmpA-like peptidoglycan-associated protein